LIADCLIDSSIAAPGFAKQEEVTAAQEKNSAGKRGRGG
jgi:hypothetical protein